MPIFRVKSVKIYTGQKNLHGRRPWRPWQIWGMHPSSVRASLPWSSRSLAFISQLRVSFLAQWKWRWLPIFLLDRNLSFIPTISFPGLLPFFAFFPRHNPNSPSTTFSSWIFSSSTLSFPTLSFSSAEDFCHKVAWKKGSIWHFWTKNTCFFGRIFLWRVGRCSPPPLTKKTHLIAFCGFP